MSKRTNNEEDLKQNNVTNVSFFLSSSSSLRFNQSDTFIRVVTLTGLFSSLTLTMDIFPTASLFLCWALYLSLMNIGREFFALQFDALLMETTFLSTVQSFFFSLTSSISAYCDSIPAHSLHYFVDHLFTSFGSPIAPYLVYWTIWWLNFRLLFSSGKQLHSGNNNNRIYTTQV